MIFENPEKVKMGGVATLSVEVLDPKLFVSSQNLEQLSSGSFKGGKTSFEFDLPPVKVDDEDSTNIGESAESIGGILRNAQGGNFIVQILLRGSS